MKTTTIKIEDKVNQLLAVLDKDIQNIQCNLSRLNELRGYVVKKDETSLRILLANIQAESNNYKENELTRRQLREELANAMDCSFEQMTLSRLEVELSGDTRNEVTQRKTQLKTLASKLKKEHSSTLTLLSDCARFNRMLLKNILELGSKGPLTYGPRGLTERSGNSAFMNTQL